MLPILIESTCKYGSLIYSINEISKGNLRWYDVLGAGAVYFVGVIADKHKQARNIDILYANIERKIDTSASSNRTKFLEHLESRVD